MYLTNLQKRNHTLLYIVYSFSQAHHNWMEKYESSRQRHNVPTQMAVDALHKLYTTDLPPVVFARSLGLQLTNALQPIKVKANNNIRYLFNICYL
jgi:2-polyprenyl-6-methoxyphenol hydroxylase-like FAD-dependent oxidoreductase